MTSLTLLRRALAVATATTAVLGIAACGATPKHHEATTPAPNSVSTAPSTSTAAKPGARNPLTGLPGVPTKPLIAVKIDDTAPGRPQVGIDKADVVYIEAVEAGLTRLAAIFATNKPTVGYVRSTRPADPDLLRQYGKITEAYSGGQRVSLDLRAKAGLTGWSDDSGASYFTRVTRAESGYINLTLDLAAVAKHTKTAAPRSNGWTFNSSLAGLTTTAATKLNTTVTGSYPIGTPVNFRWDPTLKRYVRYIDGTRQHAADGNAISATNVVVQSCKVVSYPRDKDVNGNPAQFTYTVGSGKVSVLRNGRRIDGTWSRANSTSGTTLRTANGKVLPLAPGNTWVVLVRAGIPVRS